MQAIADAARCRRGRKCLSATPVKTEERRKQGAFGSPFLWILTFAENCSCTTAFTTSLWLGEAKESIPSASAGTGIQSIIAVAANLSNI